MDQKKTNYAAMEIRAAHYRQHWQTDLMGAPAESPGFCCYATFCPCCASYGLRKRALHGDMTRYLCCAGMLPCSGRCGEAQCPEFCLTMETVFCFSQSVVSTRFMLADEMELMNTQCDNCLIATALTLQYLSCIFSCIAMCVQNDAVSQAAYIIDWIADAVWCSVCSCMQTQHKCQLDARDANPNLIQPLNPYMAPLYQQMGIPAPGYPPQGAPPPPPPAGMYPPPPPPAGYGAPQAQGKAYY